MIAPKEYTIAANVILRDLDVFVRANIPNFMGYQEQALAAMPAFAGQIGKNVVDALNAHARSSLTKGTKP